MDTKLIKEFGTEILCYRLSTVRQKKRMQYEDFDKQLIALSKEETVLYRNKYKPEWEPLTPPIQRGWKRFFVLRDDVAKSKHAGFFENILTKINTYDWSYRKDFKIRKRKFGRKIYVVKQQMLLKPDERHFNKLKFTDAEKQFFHPEYSYERGSGKFIKRYVFNEPWRYMLRIHPNMIDKTRKIDSEKELRLQIIRNYIDRNGYRNRLEKVWYRHHLKEWRLIEKPGEKDLFKNKSLSTILDITREEVL